MGAQVIEPPRSDSPVSRVDRRSFVAALASTLPDALVVSGPVLARPARQPKNLNIVVLDNGAYGETGMPQSHSGLGTDLTAVARGFGIREAFRLAMAPLSGIASGPRSAGDPTDDRPPYGPAFGNRVEY